MGKGESKCSLSPPHTNLLEGRRSQHSDWGSGSRDDRGVLRRRCGEVHSSWGARQRAHRLDPGERPRGGWGAALGGLGQWRRRPPCKPRSRAGGGRVGALPGGTPDASLRPHLFAASPHPAPRQRSSPWQPLLLYWQGDGKEGLPCPQKLTPLTPADSQGGRAWTRLPTASPQGCGRQRASPQGIPSWSPRPERLA